MYSYTQVMAFMLCFLQIIRRREADRQLADDSFWLFYGLKSLNGRNWTSYIFDELFFLGGLSFRNNEN